MIWPRSALRAAWSRPELVGSLDTRTMPCSSSGAIWSAPPAVILVLLNRCPAATFDPSVALEPPPVVVATATDGLVPPVRLEVAVMAGWSPDRRPLKVTVYGPPALPVTVTSPGS